jgi:FkbM family methyltransferase
MTTWAFNCLRELVALPDEKCLWISPGSEGERLFAEGDGPMLAKCHHFSPSLAEAADVVVYSYRDLRTAAVSYRRKFASPCSRQQLDSWLEAEKAWLPFADVVLRYEDVQRHPADGVASLRAALVRNGGACELAETSNEEVVARVEGAFRQIETSTDVAYDAANMILPQHRTFQPVADALPPAEKALYDRVEVDFANWLRSHGYIQGGDYGQEVEYGIAKVLLRSFGAPTVVDVGVERGSFAAMALAAGSSRVVGFEPLPRHVEQLAKRFPEGGRVQIHPLAISDRSGTARLHVATDLDGNELDYHHSLSDLGDSATVIRSRRALDVPTATLGDLAAAGKIPLEVDFLKIDTDGHDLSVLRGLGNLRPRVIMAEYWDTLPESSGTNPYTLKDLVDWAAAHDYTRVIVVRRHGRVELVQSAAPWTIPGDWGNVFFIAPDFDFERARAPIEEIERASYEKVCNYILALIREIEEKEAEIRRLDAALLQQRALASRVDKEAAGLHTQLQEKEALIQHLATQLKARDQATSDAASSVAALDALKKALKQLESQQALLAQSLAEKQAVILTLQKSLDHYDSRWDDLMRSMGEKDDALQDMYAAMEAPGMHLAMAKALEEKEAIIQELSAAVKAYRQAFSLYGFLTWPLNYVFAPIRRILKSQLNLLLPRLGNLNQHAPRQLSLGSQIPLLSMSSPPRVSIVTPSFRQASFIERTMRSVLDQEYPNLEYIVQDGGSEDGTREILERYAQAINRGFARSAGEIMAWLNSDDILLPGALAHVADYFNRYPDVDVVYGHRVLIDENDQEIGRWLLPAHDNRVLSWADFIPQETLFWRRRIWDKVGGKVDESFSFALDWDLLVRFREAGARFARIPHFLGGFRVHRQQKTSAAISDIGFQEMDRIRERILGSVPSQMEVRKALAPYMLRHVVTDLGWRIRNRLGVTS